MSRIVTSFRNDADTLFATIELFDDDSSNSNRETWGGAIFRVGEPQRPVMFCQHEHREEHTAKRCLRRLLVAATKTFECQSARPPASAPATKDGE